MASRLLTDTENARIVFEFYDASSAENPPEDAMKALHPDCRISEAPSLPWGGVRYGPAGAAALSAKLYELCELEMDMGVSDAGNGLVLVHGPATFTSRKTGHSVTMTVVELNTVRDGRIVDVEVLYQDSQRVNELVAED